MGGVLTVFICSTFSDLRTERKAVMDAIHRLQLQHDSMEFFGARAEQPIETCLEEVRKSDLLVVIVGHLYGTMVPGLGISYSEAEYSEGYRLRKPCLVYMRDENVPILPKHMERDPQKLALLGNWKTKLQRQHTVATFQDGKDLAVQVAADLHRIIQDFAGQGASKPISRREWSATLHVDGNLKNERHFAFEEWRVAIRVDDNGNTSQEFAARVINLSQTLITTFYVPLYSDGSNISSERIKPWSRSGRRSLPVNFDTWDEENARGRLAISHVPALRPGEGRYFRWGFELPEVFRPGDEYYNWDVEVPYYDMVGEIKFSERWDILYARWDNRGVQFKDPPTTEGRAISWRVKFPEPGVRLTLKLGIERY